MRDCDGRSWDTPAGYKLSRAVLLILVLFAYVSHHICLVLAATPPHYHFLPISLNSLDLAGFEIVESSWLTRYYHNSCRCRWYQCRWCNRAQMGAQRRPWSLLCIVQCWSVVEPSWDDRGSSSWVIFFSFGFVRSRTICVYSEWCMIYYMFIVWSGDCKPTLYPILVHYMGLCEDDPSCDKTTMRLCL